MRALIVAITSLTVVISCGTNGSSLFGPPANSDAGPPSGSSGGAPGSFGGGTNPCAAGDAIEGCACNGAASTACWTGPPADRNRGKCHDGTAQCVSKGEFFAWGPCEGEEHDCGSAPTAPDASTAPDSANGDTNDYPCPCVPGAQIWCDEDCVSAIYCSQTGKKECLPNGEWGSCHETTEPKPLFACELAGYGCSNCNGGRGYLLGDCASAFTCTLPPQPTNCSVSATVSGGVAHVTCDCH